MVGVNTKLLGCYFGRDRLLAAQKNKCFYCGSNLGNNKLNITRDHLKPKSQGYGLALNCVMSCASCNRKKASKMPTKIQLEAARNLYISMGAPAFIF